MNKNKIELYIYILLTLLFALIIDTTEYDIFGGVGLSICISVLVVILFDFK